MIQFSRSMCKRIPMRLAVTLAATGATALLAGCQSQTQDAAAGSREAQRTFHSAEAGVALTYPATLERIDGNADTQAIQGYFDNGSWKLDASAPGEALITLALPGSDAITTGLWRLGISRDPEAVRQCQRPPANAQRESSPSTLDGHAVVVFTQNDAGMNHFREVESYRSVIAATCYAIDLIVEGSNGDVYDPPRQAPFSREAAHQALREINAGLRLDG
ncbi:hypothetical protein [Salinicola tamaricis]|uniref:hypothetical protein n=1 Tax=Salinicola tamaricis TaxID=1771309 RepID=UPI000D099F72|nr:hypothetical protein [Salinicola tamaricis]